MRPFSRLRRASAHPACAIALGLLALPLPANDGPASDPQTGDLGALIGAAAPVPTWEEWWSFNQDAYLDLKRAIVAGSPATGADEIVAGPVRQKPPTLEIVRSRVLPVLRGIVETEKAAPLVGGAMIALARAGADDADDSGPAAIAILQRRLADPNQELAETATLALGILASEDGLPALEALLAGGPRGRELVGGHEVPDRLRAFAAYGLGLVAHRAENHRARQVVARALCAALDVPRISRASTPDVEIAAAIGLSLGALEPESRPSSSAPWISRQTEIRFLQGVFHDRRRRSLVRAHAVTALARLAQGAPEELASEVADDLLAAVRTKSKLENEVLQSVAQALGYLGDADSDLRDRRIRNALGQLLDDADVQTRNFALVALAEVGSRPSEGAATGEDEGTVGCRNLITGELVRGRGLTRPWAAMALGVLERRLLDRADAEANRAPATSTSGSRTGSGSSKTSRELLRRYFAGARQRTHIGAGALALGLCRDPRAVPLLLDRLRDTSEDQGQGYIAVALGMIGDPEAIEPLVQLSRSAKARPALLEDVVTALALLGHRTASVELADLLAGAQGQFAQSSYANALGRIGDDRSVDPLLEILGRKSLTASARGFAAAALGQVADPEILPWHAVIAADLNYRARVPTLLAGDGSGLLEVR